LSQVIAINAITILFVIFCCILIAITASLSLGWASGKASGLQKAVTAYGIPMQIRGGAAPTHV